MAEQPPTQKADSAPLTFDETEALYAVLIRHGDLQQDCDDHMEFDCRGDVYAAVERIIAARLAVSTTPAAPHGVAWEDGLNIICLCGEVCSAVIKRSPARLIGASDTYVDQPAAEAFARHLRDVRTPPAQETDRD